MHISVNICMNDVYYTNALRSKITLIIIEVPRRSGMCPLTGSTALLHAQVITVETRMNIFGAEKVSMEL